MSQVITGHQTAPPPSVRQRVPAGFFVAGLALVLISKVLPWSVDVPVLRGLHGPFDPMAAFLILALIVGTRMLSINPSSTGARVVAVMSAALAFVWQTSAYFDIQNYAILSGTHPVYRVGFFVGMAAWVVLVAGTVMAFATRDE